MGVDEKELLAFATVILLGAMSPGPDWVIVMQHALTSRRQGMLAAVGIALGIVAHISYCLLGVGILIENTPTLFRGIQIIGGGYLCWMGIKGLRLRTLKAVAEQAEEKPVGSWIAFRDGFVTNLFNPKATLFFLSLVSVTLDPGESTTMKLLYLLIAVGVTGGWFALLAWMLSIRWLAKLLLALQPVIQRLFGVALLALGLYVIFL